ncbi:calcium-binding protein [Francisella frigiditurris]|uniref:calcium-binding protein n=1 Tax=Francisella frigiditurris TaxID=1542390 RepID=UPI001E62B425|nr:calcium-binding protein [Francisella frigiditurris]
MNEYLTNKVIDEPANGVALLKKLSDFNDNSFSENGWDVNSLLENEVADALAESLGVNIELVDAGSYKFTADGKNFSLGSLAGTGGTDFILGTDANDTIHGGNQSDTLIGGEGNDTLIGDNVYNSSTGYNSNNTMDAQYNKGNDILAGGKGDDFLAGGYGSDTYIFNKGDGVDTIQEMLKSDYGAKYYDGGSRDTIKFGEGLNQEDVRLSISGRDLLVNFEGNEVDQLVLKDFMNNNTLEYFEFADGSKLNKTNFMSLDNTLYGTENNDSYSLFDGSDEFYAGDGNDAISGNGGDDTLYGEAGNDSLSGGLGVDTLDGGIGDDTLRGGDQNDSLVGGEGSDKLYGDNHNDTLDGGLGDDYLYGGSQSDVLTGGEGNDTLIGDNVYNSSTGYNSNNTMDAQYNKGNDILAGGKGDDFLAGGYGSDTYIFNKGDGVDTIQEMLKSDYGAKYYDGGSRDTIKFGEGLNQEDVRLSISGRDLLVNFEGNEVDQLVLKDFMNNNTLEYFEFADGSKLNKTNFMSLDNTLYGTENNDSYSLFDGSDEFYAGDGNDAISGNGGDDTLYGEAGNDSLSGGLGVDTLDGGIGDDTLRGGDQNDSLVGGEGSDKLYGDNHNDTLDGGLGDDYLYGGSQSDVLTGGEGNDTLIGDNVYNSSTGYNSNNTMDAQYNKGNDILAGGKGDDFLAGGYGSDTYIFNKGDGVDTIQEMLKSDYGAKYYDGGSRDTIKFGEGLNQEDVRLSISGRDLLVNFEGNEVDQLVLKDFMNNNTLEYFEFADGSKLNKTNFMSLDNTLYGTENNDSYSLFDGSDEFYAGDGNDAISGNGGDDTLYGEAGNDSLSGGLGVDTLDGGIGDDTLRGGDQNDSLVGGEGSDKLYGDNHNDTLDGGLGDDYLYGGSQSDVLTGGEGNDTLIGDNVYNSSTGYNSNNTMDAQYNKGNDILAGGKGDDFLAGGYGSDTYIFNKGDGVDTIQEMLKSDYGAKYYDGGSRDTIKFGEGLNQEDVRLSISGRDLLVNFEGNEVDQLVLKDFMNNNTLEYFEFADGSKLNKTNFMSLDNTLYGTENNDSYSLFDGSDEFYAGDGNDAISGNGGDDTLYGEAGNDSLSGGLGVDTLDGGIGDDTLRGGDQNDSLVGGEGSDKLYGDNHNDTLDGGLGDDYLYGGSQSDVLTGGEGNDTLIGDNVYNSSTGYNSNNTMDAQYNKGNDILAGGKGDDFLAGGYGSDTYIFNKGDGVDTIQEMLKSDYGAKYYDGGSRDTIKFGEGLNQEDVRLSISGRDLLVNFEGNEVDQLVLKDFMNNNTLEYFEFADGSKLNKTNFMSLDNTLYGTENNDSYSLFDGSDEFYAGDGNDAISGNGGDDTLYGEAGNDSLSGGLGVDTLDGGIGDDTLRGGDQNDSLVGGEGSDKLYGDNHNDTLDGGLGDDYLYGGSQSDVLTGGEGNDTLIGDNVYNSSTGYNSNNTMDAQYNKGNDILAGGKGDDFLAGGYGSDTYIFNKGDGVDTIQEMLKSDYGAKYYDGGSRDTIKFGEGLNQEDVRLSISGRDLLVNFEGNEVDQLVLKDFMNNNTLEYFEFADGSKLNKTNFMSLDNTLYGTENNDSYSLFDGSDEFYAGDGNDAISGNGGDDTLYGEAGNDSLSGGLGVDTLDGGIGDDTLRGGDQNDSLVGGEGSDKLYGDNHNDTLDGGLGDDYLYGGSQSDVLTGGEGNDTLIGDNVYNSSTGYNNNNVMDARYNKGNDVLAGGTGDDFLAGGYGSDTYIFNKGDGVDTIQEMLMSDYGAKYYDGGSRDTIKFGEGLNQEDVRLSISGRDLLVNFEGNEVDQLVLKDFMNNNTLEYFEFADGSKLNKSDIRIGSASDDTLLGNNNDNVISGNEGNDIITGGQGDDAISGGEGSDTYRYSQGDGNDTLNVSSNDGTMDTLELTDIDHDSVNLSRDGEDLLISFDSDPLGSVIVDDYFTSQYTNQGLEIDANDGFALDLSANSNKIAELLAASGADDIDMDGGSVDGIVQTTTKLSSSELADLWLPKENQ